MAPDKIYMQKQDFKNKYVSPIFGEYDNFPPMLIQVGSNEVLESDSITIYEKALKKKEEMEPSFKKLVQFAKSLSLQLATG